MKVLKNYFIKGIEESESLATIFMKDGEKTLEATYRGQAEAYRICLSYYKSIGENLYKFIEGMEAIKEFYKRVYMVEEDPMNYHKRYYAGIYFELDLILYEIK